MVLNILGARVTVIYKKGLDRDQGCLGKAVFDKHEIWVDKSLKGRLKDQVLKHEITHWALYRSGLAQGMDSLVEEAICEAIGFVFSENKL